MKHEIVSTLLQEKVTAIVRGIPADKVCLVADALLAGGVHCIEVTFNTPGAADMIRALKRDYGSKMLVGAGTVLDTETCKTAIDAGADFILSPALNTAVITMCNRYGKVAVPGVMTPTEILTAMEAGAEIVKVFHRFAWHFLHQGCAGAAQSCRHHGSGRHGRGQRGGIFQGRSQMHRRGLCAGEQGAHRKRRLCCHHRAGAGIL